MNAYKIDYESSLFFLHRNKELNPYPVFGLSRKPDIIDQDIYPCIHVSYPEMQSGYYFVKLMVFQPSPVTLGNISLDMCYKKSDYQDYKKGLKYTLTVTDNSQEKDFIVIEKYLKHYVNSSYSFEYFLSTINVINLYLNLGGKIKYINTNFRGFDFKLDHNLRKQYELETDFKDINVKITVSQRKYKSSSSIKTVELWMEPKDSYFKWLLTMGEEEKDGFSKVILSSEELDLPEESSIEEFKISAIYENGDHRIQYYSTLIEVFYRLLFLYNDVEYNIFKILNKDGRIDLFKRRKQTYMPSTNNFMTSLNTYLSVVL